MQAYEGYFENNRFYTIGKAVNIPERRRAILTVLDEPVQGLKKDDEAFWVEFDRLAVESAKEDHVFQEEAFSRRTLGRKPINFNDGV